MGLDWQAMLMSIKFGSILWQPLPKCIRIATHSHKVVILLILKVVLGLQVNGQASYKSPTLGKEKLAKALACLGGWAWLPVNAIPTLSKCGKELCCVPIRKCWARLESNCTTLLVWHTTNFSLVKQEQKSCGRKRWCCTDNVFGLTPALILRITRKTRKRKYHTNFAAEICLYFGDEYLPIFQVPFLYMLQNSLM